MAGLLDKVDFALLQRVDRLLRVGDGAPLDAVHLDDLAARNPRGRLGTRLVLVELEVDGLVTRFPLVLANTKGPDPVKSSICLLGSVSATRFGIMNGTLDEGFERPSSTRPAAPSA